jgi:hypothetical protein
MSNGSNSKGRATAKANSGTVTITARDPADGTVLASNTDVSATNATLNALTISPGPPVDDLPVGRVLQFTVEGDYSDGTQVDMTRFVTWSTSNATVADISNDDSAGTKGIAWGVTASSVPVTITATDPSSTVSDPVDVTVNNANLVSLVITPDDNPTNIPSQGKQFSAMGTFDDGRVRDVTLFTSQWSVAPNTLFRVSNVDPSRGFVGAISAGAGTLSVFDPGGQESSMPINIQQ